MADYPIATDPAAVAVLAEVLADGRSAIGAQLHPWVTPPFDEAVTPANLSRRALRHRARDDRAARRAWLLAFSFHSPSLEPGHTPFVRDADDLGAFWRWWEGMFARLARRGGSAAGMMDMAGADAIQRRLAAVRFVSPLSSGVHPSAGSKLA